MRQWLRQFKQGWTSVESAECSGRPSMSKNQLMIDKVCSAVLDNRRISIRELSDRLGLLFSLVLSILTKDFGMKCVSVKFVPKLLTVKCHLVQNILAKYQVPKVLQPPIHRTWSLVNFSIPRYENAVEREQVSRHGGGKTKFDDIKSQFHKCFRQ
jgi:hypothetical protein